MLKFKTKQANSIDSDVTNKMSHVFPSTINSNHDDATTLQPFVSLPSSLQTPLSSAMSLTPGKSPSLEEISKPGNKNSAFTSFLSSKLGLVH